MKTEEIPGGMDHRTRLRRFLHDVSAPLSAVSLHLEAASRRAARGDDPSDSIATARRELSRAFEMFERGREELLKSGSSGDAA
jgi:hypothetical protein